MAEKTRKLKPCPFCGSREVAVYADAGRYGYFVYAKCAICGARSATRKNTRNLSDNEDDFWKDWSCSEVSMLWNTRKRPEKQDSQKGVKLDG